VRYQEKQVDAWKCGVCEQIYSSSQNFCLSCYQSLYYFSYINNQLFVTKDDSYLQLYYQDNSIPIANDYEDSDASSEDSNKDPTFEWVENLLMWIFSLFTHFIYYFAIYFSLTDPFSIISYVVINWNNAICYLFYDRRS